MRSLVTILPYILAGIYLLPAAGLILYPLERSVTCGSFHSFFGRIEWVLSFLRDIALTLLIVLLVACDLKFWPFLLFIPLSVWAYLRRRRRIGKFLNFVNGRPAMDPRDFFGIYYAAISGLPGRFPEGARTLSLPINYFKGNEDITIWPVFPGLVSSAIISRLVLRMGRCLDAESRIAMADKFQAVWGARVLELLQAKVDISGAEGLGGVNGRVIFVCNHKSFVDFAVSAVAFYLAGRLREKPFRPRYMAARDHFYDNKFLYSVIKIGRAMEAVGTIFVDRKGKKEKPVRAVDSAARAIAESGVDIVMYPQGTRARAGTDRYGRRLDAGYYTTVRRERISDATSHLKKGAAYLARDAAAALAPRGEPVSIVPVGIIGTGIAAPKGSIRVQLGVGMKVVFGKAYAVSQTDSVEGLHQRIDGMLKDACQIHSELKKRLVFDIKRVMSEDQIERFFEAMKAWRSDEDLIFSIIDCIYALPQGLWGVKIKRLYQLLSEADTPRGDLLAFKSAVFGEMKR